MYQMVRVYNEHEQNVNFLNNKKSLVQHQLSIILLFQYFEKRSLGDALNVENYQTMEATPDALSFSCPLPP